MSETELQELPLWAGRARNTDPSTSKKAVCQGAILRWGSQKSDLLAAYMENGPLTDEEAGKITGLLEKRACYWKRTGELRDMGYIEDTGATRPSSHNNENMVCRITTEGQIALIKIMRKEK